MKTSAHETVAAEVRAVAARKRVSHGELAATLGMSVQAFSRRMTGAVPFDVGQIGALAEHLGVPVASLFVDATAVPA